MGCNQRVIFHTGLASVGLRKSRQPLLATASGVKRSQRPNRLRCPGSSSKSPASSALKQRLANEKPLFQGGWQVDAIPLNRHVAHQVKRSERILGFHGLITDGRTPNPRWHRWASAANSLFAEPVCPTMQGDGDIGSLFFRCFTLPVQLLSAY